MGENYNFSPGQELSQDYHQEEEGEGEEADPQLQLWNSWEEERPQGEKMGDATPWPSTSVLSHAAVWLVNSSLLDIMYALSLDLVNQFTHISYSFHIWLHYKLVYCIVNIQSWARTSYIKFAWLAGFSLLH